MIHTTDIKPGLRWTTKHRALWWAVNIGLLPVFIVLGIIHGVAEFAASWWDDAQLCPRDCWCRRKADAKKEPTR